MCIGISIDNTERQNREIDARMEKTVKLYHSIDVKFLNMTEVTRQERI